MTLVFWYMDNKKIFLKHHLGLGDNIVHNGMVRKICEDFKDYQINLPSKPNNYDNVRFMYRDNPNINVVMVSNDFEMNKHISSTKYDKIISSYLIDQNTYDYSKYYDDAFYLQAGYDPNIKLSHFHLERDIDEENRVFKELILDNGIVDYIFVHEKKEDSIIINRDKIENNLPIIYADKKYKTFSLLKVIERAKECHIISSSFLSLLMCYKLNENVYAHMYSDRSELSEYVKNNNIKVIL
jgi:hypothetical protein